MVKIIVTKTGRDAGDPSASIGFSSRIWIAGFQPVVVQKVQCTFLCAELSGRQECFISADKNVCCTVLRYGDPLKY